jgi:ribosomal protein S27AE
LLPLRPNVWTTLIDPFYVGGTKYNSTMNEKLIQCPQCGDTVIESDMREVGVCWECDYLPEEK